MSRLNQYPNPNDNDTCIQLCGRRSEIVGEDHPLARARRSQESGRREGVPGREEAGRVRRTGRTRRDVLAPDDEGQSVSRSEIILHSAWFIRETS